MASSIPRHPSSHANTPASISSPGLGKKRAVPDTTPILQPVKQKLSITDRNIPSKVEGVVPESRLYRELQDFEKRLDATIMRKRLDIQEALNTKPIKTTRTLRVFISNLATNQNVQDEEGMELDFQSGNIPSWTLRIEGRLLDPQNPNLKGKYPPRKFSSFFKSIIVELDRNPDLYPEGNIMEWNRTSSTQECDGFEIKRKGDQNIKAKIYLTLNYYPERYKLIPAFSDLLDIREETKTGIIKALWQYVKLNKLQDPDDQRIINNDERLQMLFHRTKMSFPEVPELLNPLLEPLDPIEIDYRIRVDKAFHQSRFAYDIEVEVDDILKNRMQMAILSSTGYKEVQALDEKIIQCIQSINNSKTKRDFLLQFAHSPVNFINKWVASQSQDLEMILGESRVNVEEQRKSDFYKQGWVNEAIFHYTSAKIQRRMHELLANGGASNMGGYGIPGNRIQ